MRKHEKRSWEQQLVLQSDPRPCSCSPRLSVALAYLHTSLGMSNLALAVTFQHVPTHTHTTCSIRFMCSESCLAAEPSHASRSYASTEMLVCRKRTLQNHLFIFSGETNPQKRLFTDDWVGASPIMIGKHTQNAWLASNPMSTTNRSSHHQSWSPLD